MPLSSIIVSPCLSLSSFSPSPMYESTAVLQSSMVHLLVTGMLPRVCGWVTRSHFSVCVCVCWESSLLSLFSLVLVYAPEGWMINFCYGSFILLKGTAVNSSSMGDY